MAHWILLCPHCKSEFNQSQVVTDKDFGIEIKPVFPDGGLMVQCSNCHKSSVFLRYQLRYGAA